MRRSCGACGLHYGCSMGDHRPIGSLRLRKPSGAHWPGLVRTLPSFERKPLIWLALVGAVCLPDGGNAEQIEGVALGPGGGGENGDEAIAPEADDIAGERGEVAEQGMEAVHREWFALCRLGAFAGGLAARGW